MRPPAHHRVPLVLAVVAWASAAACGDGVGTTGDATTTPPPSTTAVEGSTSTTGPAPSLTTRATAAPTATTATPPTTATPTGPTSSPTLPPPLALAPAADVVVPGGYVVVSHTGSLLASTSFDGTVRCWDLADGTQRFAVAGGFVAPVFSADDRHLVTIGPDGAARVWDTTSGVLVTSTPGVEGRIGGAGADLSPDGSLLVTGSGDRVARIWDAATGRLLHTLDTGDDGDVGLVAFGETGTRVLSAQASVNRLDVWDPTSGALLATFRGHTSPVFDARFLPGDREVVSFSFDGTIRRWDATSGVELDVLRPTTGDLGGASLNASGTLLVVWGSMVGGLRVHAVDGFDLLADFEGSGPPAAAEISADGSVVVLAAFGVAGAPPTQVLVLDGTTLEPLARGQTDGRTPRDVAIGPDGKLIAATTDDGTVLVWTW